MLKMSNIKFITPILAKIIKITVQDAQLNYVNDDKRNNYFISSYS